MVVLLPCVAAVEGEVVLPAAEAQEPPEEEVGPVLEVEEPPEEVGPVLEVEEPPEEVAGPALEVVGAVVAVLARDDVEEGPEFINPRWPSLTQGRPPGALFRAVATWVRAGFGRASDAPGSQRAAEGSDGYAQRRSPPWRRPCRAVRAFCRCLRLLARDLHERAGDLAQALGMDLGQLDDPSVVVRVVALGFRREPTNGDHEPAREFALAQEFVEGVDLGHYGCRQGGRLHDGHRQRLAESSGAISSPGLTLVLDMR